MFVSIKCYDVFGLCRITHTDILHLVVGSDCIFNVCHNCFCKLLCSANISCNHLVLSVFKAPHCLVVILLVNILSMGLILFVITVVEIFLLF